jgi:phosphopantothenoylcysteine decarboxylase/phosphopantothenate--cysteine ligase
MLKGKTLLLGGDGRHRLLQEHFPGLGAGEMHCDVRVVMTKNATEFISPMIFEQFTGHRTVVDTFDRNHGYTVEHVALADRADMVLIAPATPMCWPSWPRHCRRHAHHHGAGLRLPKYAPGHEHGHV